MGFVLSFFFGFFPMLLFAGFVYWLDRYEREPRKLILGVFLWGALIAAGLAFIVNTAIGSSVYTLTGSESLTNLTTGSLIAPVVEEILKALAVLGVFLIFRREFDSILDGIIYAAITALGFAATENTYYIYSYGFQQNSYQGLLALVFVRVFLVGWQHPFYTAFFGIGLAAARINRAAWKRILFPFLGLLIGILLHAAHNTISEIVSGFLGLAIGTLFDWSGWMVMFGFTLWMIARESHLIEIYLSEEVAVGLITEQQFQTSCSGWKRFNIGLKTWLSPSYAPTRRFYQLCAELAHKKNQYYRIGDEKGNAEIIKTIRKELADLSALVN